MAKAKKEEVVENTTQEQVVEETTKQEQPKVDDNVEKIKVKTKMKKFNKEGVDSDIIKVDLNKSQTEDSTEEKQPEKVENTVEEVKEEAKEEAKEEVKEEKVEETPIIEEVVDDEKEIEKVAEKVQEVVEEAEAAGKPLPESIEKLMKFMEDTGGDLQDYVKLNTDINKLDDNSVLREYYKQTKPHLTGEEINFLMEDQFSYDEEIDEERDIKRKKLALKEQVASARAHLDGQKSKYYEEIKAGSKLTSDQQKAIDFFNRYNKESEQTKKIVKQNTDAFTKETNNLFNDNFKGFEYNVGDKKYRFNVKNKSEIKETQSNLDNFTAKFVDKNSTLIDAKGYHKSIFTAMNADTIAQHFYEQGKADALKDSMAKSKNINMDPRQSHKEVNVGGVKVKVLGEDASDFKFKIKNKR